jgi:hypothetical protein
MRLGEPIVVGPGVSCFRHNAGKAPEILALDETLIPTPADRESLYQVNAFPHSLDPSATSTGSDPAAQQSRVCYFFRLEVLRC